MFFSSLPTNHVSTDTINTTYFLKQIPVGVFDQIIRKSTLQTTPISTSTSIPKNPNYFCTKFEFKLLNPDTSTSFYDSKFNFFTKNLYQNLYETFDKHTIIFCGNPFDYYRLKRYFKSNYSSVSFMSDTMDKSELQKNRFKFETGQTKFLLYSERLHYYKKVNVRVVKNVVFYSLPEDPNIFKEIVDLCNPSVYKEKLNKFDIKGVVEMDSAVISLILKGIEWYQLEKVMGRAMMESKVSEGSGSIVI